MRAAALVLAQAVVGIAAHPDTTPTVELTASQINAYAKKASRTARQLPAETARHVPARYVHDLQ